MSTVTNVPDSGLVRAVRLGAVQANATRLAKAYILDSAGGVPHQFPIQFTFNLNTGKATGNWNNPVTGQAETTTITLTFFKRASRTEGKYYIFYGDRSSDQAGYVIAFLLL